MNPTQVNQYTSQARSQGQALQNQYNQQAAQTYGQYQQSYGNAQNAQQKLLDFTSALPNYGDLYGKALTGAQQMYGFDPTQLLKANQALAHTNTAIANLPQAIQQQGNYYGTTAGSEAANYANLAGNLNAVQQGQANTANAFQNVLAATQQQANQQTTQQLTGQAQQLQGYQQFATNAVNIMQNAGQTMAQIEQLQQNQGYATAQQVAAYQNAYSQYVQAQAAATQASAQAKLLAAQTAQQQLTNQQMQAYMNSQAYKNYTKTGTSPQQQSVNTNAALQNAKAADLAQKAATKNSQTLNFQGSPGFFDPLKAYLGNL